MADATDINGDLNQSNEPYGGFVDQWRDKSGASRHAGDRMVLPSLSTGGIPRAL